MIRPEPTTLLTALAAMALSCRAVWRDYRDALHCRRQMQAARKRLTAKLREAARKRELAHRVPNPGYDELRSPVFLGVMAAAVVVLVVDVPDAWPALAGVLRATARTVGQAMIVWAGQA